MHFQNLNNSNTLSLSPSAYQPCNLDRLAKASSARKWILFTAQTHLPELKDLQTYSVDCEKIIQLKPSNKSNEMEVVIKAITSGNASAVVASGNIDAVAQKQLQQLGKDHDCDVFFSTSNTQYLH
ncbi:hypothetical protein AB4152_14550 [Vibrio breoganii]|uniref:hypothetical protein n=1 Tax=Vibrio breoganii TaxID=553239 RepID=UPI00080EDA57|nr:hypothetical protein [Vibrio breoganii]OCH74608.1 hypothetical protein A6D95_13640 [Vibrio breoganii]PMF75364.1 hypothetical protein BCV08_17460 [Vibrio breoganii]PML28215.1 hypothetical protein BCT82_02055 [Vibrio breoganii]TKG24417.1 hypothetical protein FCV87_18260 [Vibrio breoganii]